VDAAAATNRLPLQGEDWVGELTDPDQPPRSADQSALANNRFVTPAYWNVMGIPLKQGRLLDESDKGKLTALISERAARFLWGDQNPIGKRVEGVGSETPRLEIVGVVGEVRASGLERPLTMMIYEHYGRMRPLGVSFVVRTRADPAAVIGSIHALLSRADPEMAIPPARTMEQIVEESVASRRFEMYLTVAFALAALLLASLGIYGVISFSVARRTPEIGIRIALGARAGELARMILKEGMIPVLIGLVAGLLTAGLTGRIISSQLYGVTSNDPWTILGVSTILLAIAACACWFPARRATRVDPLVALRFE
jgi:putative ABC transport system permease protein